MKFFDHIRYACGLGFLLFAVAGCTLFPRSAPERGEAWTQQGIAEPVEREPLRQEWLQPSAAAFTLGPGDWLEIEVLGDVETRSLLPVGPDGRIYFHVVPGVDVWGLTPGEARLKLQDALAPFYRDPPRLSVTVREVGSKQVWLLGRLAQPGIYPMSGPMTLLEGISLAGGPAPTPQNAVLADGGMTTSTDEAADLRRAFLMRQGELLAVDFHRLVRYGDMSQNLYLEPGDLIYVPSAQSQEIHILGAVETPRAVPYTRRSTVLTAIAAAGGTAEEAHLSQVAVLRGSFNHPQMIVVDYRDVVRGLASDILLEPGDIVYVPLTPYRILTRYADLILTTFARTIGVNAGARAVSRDGGVGITIPAGP